MGMTKKSLMMACMDIGIELRKNAHSDARWSLRGPKVEAPPEYEKQIRENCHPSAAAMTLSDYRAWGYNLDTLWEVDSIIRLLKTGVELNKGSRVVCVKGEPAKIKVQD